MSNRYRNVIFLFFMIRYETSFGMYLVPSYAIRANDSISCHLFSQAIICLHNRTKAYSSQFWPEVLRRLFCFISLLEYNKRIYLSISSLQWYKYNYKSSVFHSVIRSIVKKSMFIYWKSFLHRFPLWNYCCWTKIWNCSPYYH